MDQILYCVFAAVALVAALLSVTRKNAVAAACWLVIMFFGLAAIFVLLEAYFVAAVQILVYAGAIMVLFLFVIMLLDLRSAELKAHAGPSLKLVGVLLAGVFFGAVVYAVSDAAASTKIADRVSAVLRLPAPPPPPPNDDPLKPAPPAPEAPAPVAVEMAEQADLASAGERPPPPRGAALNPNDMYLDSPRRAYEGKFSLAGKPHVVAVRFQGPLVWHSIDGKDANPAASTPGSIDLAAAIGAPAGTMLEVTVQSGGLENSAGGGPDGSPRAIGKSIFETWLLPFEITSLLLTGAIFGAVVLTKRKLS